jgi:hypothetical protein
MTGLVEFTPPEDLNPKLSDRVSRAIAHAMQTKVPDRPSSVAVWQTELKAIRKELKAEAARLDAEKAALYQQMQAAVADKDWGQVLQKGKELQTLDPNYKDAPDLVNQARSALEKAKAERIAASAKIPWLWMGIGAAILVAVVFTVVYFSSRGGGNGDDSSPTAVAEATTTPTEAELVAPPETPTKTPTPSATNTPLFTPTSTGTPRPTFTPISPTNTPIPSTATPVPPTVTATSRPTNTPSPTLNPTPTSTPTLHTPTATATNTPSPATNTPSPTTTPTSTPTPITPTSTPAHTPTNPFTPTCDTITLVAPEADRIVNTNHMEVRWRCNGIVPEEYGFEIKLWLPGAAPLGAHDAINDQVRVQQWREDYVLTIGVEDAAGYGGSGKNYLVAVSLVRLSPGYQDTGLMSDPVSFIYR